jgi:uncharacterized protein
MIYETIVTTQNQQADSHIAPMGIHVTNDDLIVMPFRPSSTLNNFLETGVGVINYCDDVRVFAGCLTGRKEWPLVSAQHIQGKVLACALAHAEIELVRIEEDNTRPKLFCKTVYANNHAPFQGYNRAQYSVLEAAILISRLGMLPIEKIEAELTYLKIGLDKTAGAREIEAWGWLMATFIEFKGRAVA